MLPPFFSKTIEKLKFDRRLQQRTLFYGATALGVMVTGVGFYYWNQPVAVVQKQPSKKGKSVRISNGSQNIKEEEVWVSRIEREIGGLQKMVDEMGKAVGVLAGQKLANDGARLSQNSAPAPQNHLPNHLSGQPRDDVAGVREEVAVLKGSGLKGSGQQNAQARGEGQGQVELKPVPASDVSLQPMAASKGGISKPEIRKVTFQLDQRGSKRVGKSVDHYVPAGSFARGVLTSGVVASTSVGSASNPRPVHIQLTDFGTLPRKFKSDIKGCFLIGTSYGDMASERVFMRLEKMSCVERKTGEVIELTVDGYVSGEDGANGVRGILVDRSGPALRNAFIGGFVGGMGNFFGSQNANPLSIAGGGIANINPMNAQQLLQSGASKGIGNSMEKLSDFYIKRGEQLQPCLEIEGGRAVDVVFTSGFDMAQTLYRRALMADNDQERRTVVQRSSQGDQPSFSEHNSASPSPQGGFYDQR